jgi:hypothetical protein
MILSEVTDAVQRLWMGWAEPPPIGLEENNAKFFPLLRADQNKKVSIPRLFKQEPIFCVSE